VPGLTKGQQELEKAAVLLISLNWELFAKDALHRNESCGHFREEYQTADGESNVTMKILRSCMGVQVMLFTEALVFDNVKLVTRSYK
jgi:hypothetical protein